MLRFLLCTFENKDKVKDIRANMNKDIVPNMDRFYEPYKKEHIRLHSLRNWVHPTITAVDLARNGFFWVGGGVQCAFCLSVYADWKEGDVVANVHRKYSPECPFAFGYECGNVPLSKKKTQILRPLDISDKKYVIPRVIGNLISTPTYREWGDWYKRTKSFTNWPLDKRQTPIDLSRSGLLYMGTEDRCKCFWCGIELRDWRTDDDPIEEHLTL